MTVSLAEATAAARRIQADAYVSVAVGGFCADAARVEDARLLAGFVLAGDTERIREALEAERDKVSARIRRHDGRGQAATRARILALDFALSLLAGGRS